MLKLKSPMKAQFNSMFCFRTKDSTCMVVHVCEIRLGLYISEISETLDALVEVQYFLTLDLCLVLDAV